MIGGVNDFQEYAHGYYGVTIDIKSYDATIVAKENKKTKENVDFEEEELLRTYNPLYICITNASNPICFALISYLLSGEILKLQPDLVLTLYDADDSTFSLLNDVAEDIMNMGYGTLKEKVRVTSDVKAAFQECQIVIFLDELPCGSTETRQEWLMRSSDIFSNYGQVLNQVAHRNVKVFVAGAGNINLHLNILIENTPNIQRKNFVGVSRFLEFHAKLVLADALNVHSSCIANVAIWGKLNHNYLINIQKSRVYECDCSIVGPPSFSLPSVDLIFKEKWLKSHYNTLAQSRKKNVEKLLRHPEYNLHARSIALTLNDIWNGSATNNFFSLALASQGWYGVPEGLVFSFPVQFSVTGNYNVIEDFELTPEFEQQLLPIIKELDKDKRLAAGEIITDSENDDKKEEKDDLAVTETVDEKIPETITEEATENSEKVPEDGNPENEEEEIEGEEEGEEDIEGTVANESNRVEEIKEE